MPKEFSCSLKFSAYDAAEHNRTKGCIIDIWPDRNNNLMVSLSFSLNFTGWLQQTNSPKKNYTRIHATTPQEIIEFRLRNHGPKKVKQSNSFWGFLCSITNTRHWSQTVCASSMRTWKGADRHQPSSYWFMDSAFTAAPKINVFV